MTRVLVTGGSGFVGACAVRELVRRGHDVHVLLRDPARAWRLEGGGKFSNLPISTRTDRDDLGADQSASWKTCRHVPTIHVGDLCDADSVRRAFDVSPDVVLHLATHGAYESQADARTILDTNIVGTLHLLEAAADAKVKLFVQTGSSSEYGFRSEPMTESDRLDPNSVYAVAKSAQTHLGQLWARRSAMPVVTLRLFSVYGPWEEPTRLIPTLLDRARNHLPLLLASPDTVRDFVYVDDIVEALLDFEYLPRLGGETLNLGSGVETTLRELVETATQLLGSRSEIRWNAFPARSWDATRWCADPRKAIERLGWSPRHSLCAGLAKTAAWLDERRGLSPPETRRDCTYSEGINPSARRTDLRALSATVRRTILDRSYAAGVGHIGSALSVAEMLVAVWGRFLRKPATDDHDRDRFVLCKGHAALALYAVMHACGRIGDDDLASYCRDGSRFGAHPEFGIPGVEVGTGSLGQGLSVACGIALAMKRRRSPGRVVALLSDAECNEGQVWEAAQFAAHHRLANLIALVDANGMQALGPTADILDLDSLEAKWTAFGWQAVTVDGHDAVALAERLDAPTENGRPRMLICRTRLGNGVSFMENRHEWHYRNLTPELYAAAVGEPS